MKAYAEQAFERIDAAFFLSGEFQNQADLNEIEMYIQRWQREIDRSRWVLMRVEIPHHILKGTSP